MLDQNYQDTAHLLRRAGFGADPSTIVAAANRSLAAVTDDLLHPERTPDLINDDAIITRLSDLVPEQRKTNKKTGAEYLPVQVVKTWWAHRMLASPHPLVEKMTLFWHGHFTSRENGMGGEFMLAQNQLFRRNALGNFRTLTQAVSRDPEMLRYLNGNQNYKSHPNENYGRELMELYTCGIGHYTEDDVKAAARAFSGWNLRDGEFYFNPRQHDDSLKTFMGHTGNWNGDDIVDMLVAHPATARRLCTQLFTYFAYPEPEPAALDALVKTYYETGYDIRAVLSQIFHSHAFYSPRARYAIIKSPVQFVIGSVKMLGLSSLVTLQPGDITPANDMAANPGNSGAAGAANPVGHAQGAKLGALAGIPVAMRNIGQDILAPPSVKGWDGGEAWINSTTLLARLNFANTLSQTKQAFDGQFVTATDYVQSKGLDAAGWVDFLAASLGPLPLTPQTRQTLIDYVNTAGTPADQTPSLGAGGTRRRRLEPGGLEGRLRGVIPLIMATAEYQVC